MGVRKCLRYHCPFKNVLKNISNNQVLTSFYIITGNVLIIHYCCHLKEGNLE